MVELVATRKARFMAALALKGMTQGDWARQEDIHRGYLNRVLNGHLESRTLVNKIENFILDSELQHVG